IINLLFVFGRFVRLSIPSKTSPRSRLCDKNSLSYTHFSEGIFLTKLDFLKGLAVFCDKIS
ncbi:hypothetical protein, partial [Streptomyces djakartensis]|uniref:hypothetical protein n=1 Tax=Streptomyces djakartensis TaxID=68193 RepID=UPI0034DDFB3F